MIRNRITRIIAGVISCILVSVFVTRFKLFFMNNQKQWRENDNPTFSVSNDVNDIYYKLWIVGNMWLRNLDEDGKFKGNKELEKQTVSALQELDCMDSKGNIKLYDIDNDYEYLVSYGNNSFSNTDKSYEEFNGDFVMTRRNDNILYMRYHDWSYSNNDFNVFDTNYGMHYYYINGKGVALFDYDTTGLNSYVDDLGATIYYKTDGSTPLPDEYYNFNYGYSYDGGKYREEYFDGQGNLILSEELTEDEYYDRVNSLGKTPVYDEDGEIVSRETSPEYEDGLYVYMDDRFIKVEQEKFKTTQLKETPLTIAIKPSDAVISELENYFKIREDGQKNAVHSIMNDIPLLIVALVLVLFVLITGGYSTKEKKFVMTVFDKIFAEISVAFIILAVTGGVFFCDMYEIFDFIQEFYGEQMFPAIYGVIYFLLAGIILLMLNSLITRIKCRCFWKTTFIYHFIVTIWKWLDKFRNFLADKTLSRNMLRDDKFTRRFIVRTVAFGIAECFCTLLFFDWGAYVPFFFFSFILFIGYMALSILDLMAMNRISKHITAINSGDYTPHTENKYSSAYCITQKLNNISAGIQTAVDNQVKSERMKIDLVTNVSHDLKTPLTSIISYIDLLSSEELSPEAKDYVTIIENKSHRLKSMVEDLFDLAKATSRTDIDMEKIDAVILANQVLADLSDKIEATGKQLKTDIQADSAPVVAEGKKMYRVFQNLIDNALKYSLDGTRIYFTLKNEAGYCVVTIKNIASYEMNFAPDEIIERFTRGDESRSTEGNGLGLSIAKNFTEACGGMFRISVDGDVFTAEIKLPINNIMQ